MKRAALAFTVVVAASVLATAPEGASARSPAPTATRFLMHSFGFATRSSGSEPPVARSDLPAYGVIGCTTRAGLETVSKDVGLQSWPVTSVRAAATTLSTVKHAGKVSSWARDSIAEVTLDGGLTLKGIRATSHAYYDRGFKQHTTSALASVSFGGVTQTLPTPGHPVTIPGVGTITVGDRSNSAVGPHGAVSAIAAVRIVMSTSHWVIILGRAQSTIADAVVGAFHGRAYGSQSAASVNDDRIYNSPRPLLVMACEGTHGATLTRQVANSSSGCAVHGARTVERGQQVGDKADMWTRSKVRSCEFVQLDLRGPSVDEVFTISGIRAEAHVWFVRGTTSTVRRSSAGTTPGVITSGGVVIPLPPSGTLNLPSEAKIETNIVTRTAHGLRVIAVRVTRTRGAGVTNLGYASASFTPSP